MLSLAVSELAHALAWAPPSNVDRGERWYNSPRFRTPPATLEGPSVPEPYSKTVDISQVNILAGGKLFYLDTASTIRKMWTQQFDHGQLSASLASSIRELGMARHNSLARNCKAQWRFA